jgi:hypothetical protein
MIVTYQAIQLFQKLRISKIIKPNVLTMMIGIVLGFLALLRYGEESIKELRSG